MNPFPIDAYAYSNRLRWTHPGEKIIFAGVIITVCLISGAAPVCLLGLLLATLAVTVRAGIALSAFWYFVRLPVGFIVMGIATVAIIVVPQDAPGTLVAVQVGPWHLGMTTDSFAAAGRIFGVSIACVSSTLFLALTTPMVDLADQLLRWRVPVLFVELMTLVYRFIFVLLETAQAMHIAQESRLGYSTWGRTLRSVGMLASNLYIRANTRAEALFTALSARGYTGELRVLRETPHWSATNLRQIAAAGTLLLIVAVGVHVAGLG